MKPNYASIAFFFIFPVPELLELLWVLEATVAEYPRMAELLAQVVAGECLGRDALPEPPAGLRKPPTGRAAMGSLF